MLPLILALVVIPAIGGFFLVRGKARSLRRLQASVDADVRNRLSAAGREVQGNVSADGHALETKRGTLTLVASKAPESFVIDIAKFSGNTSLRGVLTVVRLEDAGKVLATRNLHVLKPKDPKVAERFHVLVSDPERGDRWANAKLADSLQALETSVRARCRLQVAHETATILVFRGLAKADELKSFHEGAVRVLEVLDASA